MQGFLKKLNITKFDLAAFAVVIVVYFGTRLVNLLLIPIFTDEAIYLRWSQIMAHDAGLRYLPLSDGKPPLFMWLMSAMFRLFPSFDLLYAGRLTAVFSGFFGLTGLYFAGRVLFKEKLVANLAVILYLFIPFTLFYDRIALADSLLAAFGIWSIGLGVLLAKTLRLDVAMLLGWMLGFGYLTKTPAFFFVLIQPLLFFVRPLKSFRLTFLDFLKFIALVGLAFIESQIIFSALRLLPLFHMIGRKNFEFALTLSEFLKNPFALFPSNFKTLISWEVGYLTIPLVAVLVLGLIVAIKRKFLAPLILTLCFLGFVTAMSFFNKVLFVRYLLALTPALILAISYGLFETLALIKKTYLKVLVLALVLAWPFVLSLQLLINPLYAQIPKDDSTQYLHSWAAGFGIQEVRAYLSKQPGKSLVITEGTFGLMPYALELYQKDYPEVEIKPYWPLPNTPPPEATASANPVFVLMYQNQSKPQGWNMTEVLRFKQGLGTDYLRLYKLTK